MSDRRSTRVRTPPPSIYAAAAALAGARQDLPSDDSGDDESGDESVDNAAELRLLAAPAKRAKAAPRATKAAAKGKPAGALYHACIKPQKKGSTTLDASAVTDWVNGYDDDPAQAGAALLTFIFAACGASDKKTVDEGVDVEALDAARWRELRSDVLEQLGERKGDVRLYPLIDERPKATASNFRPRFCATWHALVDACQVGSDYDKPALEAALKVAVQLSTSDVVHVRHTATCAALEMGAAIAAAAARVDVQLATAVRQLEAQGGDESPPDDEGADEDEASTAKSPLKKKAKPASSKAEHLSGKVSELTSCLAKLEALSDRVFSSVFVLRYRDADVLVRVCSISAFGRWMAAWPRKYVVERYIKYPAWFVHFEDARERRAAVVALAALFDLPHADVAAGQRDALLETLALVAQRYTVRFAEMVHDVDPTVQLEAVRLLAAMLKAGALDDDDVSDHAEEAAKLVRAKSCARRWSLR
ncbi:hypothetical protein M885DRAFT_97120 [Pelagophyceae sp. CCMP2097]|nr:hypothetical protein M885DRAFT_97120 [Pelagophyceae sp. CCMP2097]